MMGGAEKNARVTKKNAEKNAIIQTGRKCRHEKQTTRDRGVNPSSSLFWCIMAFQNPHTRRVPHFTKPHGKFLKKKRVYNNNKLVGWVA
jgi:hypothetical protein